MKPFLTLFFALSLTVTASSQKVDSLFFNLYTDSLKKGTHNYINVDGKLSNGQWLPLTGKELVFSSSYGKFDGNSLFVDTNFKGEKISVKVALKNDPSVTREITIFIKKYFPVERLKTVDEILGDPRRRNSRNKKALG
ncbi:MAG: hypothetical protein H7Y31_18560 [Chitinophagaceae bacterium]|nr:hypothetical protein [Chitinophagaceae bacterium]